MLAAAVCIAAQVASLPPARLIPPPPPADLDSLVAKDLAADLAAARRCLLENGVATARRRDAAAARAKAAGSGEAGAIVAVMDAIVECAGTCGATRDLADLLVSMAAEAAKDPAALERLSTAARDPASPLRLAALRTLAAMAPEARPDAVRSAAVRTIALKAIPGAMKYDVTEVRAAPGEVLEFVMENPDSMQHNLLVTTPGKMPEVGVACDKMGETLEGKGRQFVPDLPSVLAAMGLVDPGRTGRVFWVVPDKAGTYPFVCTYPGHWRTMNGRIKVTAPAPR
ncbi:MAG: plastocyanin/azurin family copper-binding protein [Phycisphaerales bacterium]